MDFLTLIFLHSVYSGMLKNRQHPNILFTHAWHGSGYRSKAACHLLRRMPPDIILGDRAATAGTPA
jgi:hypothetical protein